MVQTLMKLGLSEKEAHVYLAMLELAEETAQNIAKKAKVNRATTYVILEKLMRLGLASTVERGKKTVFIAESPTELVNLLEAQKREIDSKKQYLDDSLNQLLAIYNARGDKPIVRYFEGADGLEALDRYGHDQFAPGSEVVGMVPIDMLEAQFPSRRREAVHDRVALGIRSRMLYTHKDGEIPQYVNEEELREGIFLSREEFPIDMCVSVYKDWGVKFYSLVDGQYLGILIQNPAIARNLGYIFQLAWEGAEQRRRARE